MSAPTSGKVGAAVWDGHHRVEHAGDLRNPPPTPPGAPDDPAQLLDDLRSFIARFVAFPLPAALDAVVLWAAHTHMAEHFHTSPRLALLSPEPSSGKTRVLEVLQTLVPNSMFSFSASPAAIFRKLAQGPHTLLFDEVDAIFTKRGKDDGNEDLRALLNVGYRRGATIPRCVGPQHDVRDFAVFAPTALAGLGDLPDTIMSRSVIIRMRRRAPNEHVAQFRLRMHASEGAALCERLAAWAGEVGAEVGAAWPDLPSGVVDRDAEVWEPLIAVADAAGGHWPATARAACVESLKVAADREVSLGVRLLGDLRVVFGERDAMGTTAILEVLNEMREAPWGDLYGKKMEPRTLARMLKRYGVSSVKVKVDKRSVNGYRREHLWDAWARYLPADTAQGEPEEPTADVSDWCVLDAPGGVLFGFPSVATVGEPAAPTRGTEVPQVPAPPHQEEPATRVPDGAPAKVPQVPPAREEGRPHVKPDPSSLAGRAAPLAQRIGAMAPVDIQRIANELLAKARSAPAWLRSTVIAEPVAVAVALSMVEEDARSGTLGAFPTYLTAARTATNGATPG